MNIGDHVKCIWTQRSSKAYNRYGTPAVNGDVGVIQSIQELRDVTLIVFKSDRGAVYCHIQNASLTTPA